MVKWGILWSDPYLNKNRSLSLIVGESIVAFHKKFHHAPTHCTLCPTWYASVTPEEITLLSSTHHVEVDSSPEVQAGHLTIGYPGVPEWWNK